MTRAISSPRKTDRYVTNGPVKRETVGLRLLLADNSIQFSSFQFSGRYVYPHSVKKERKRERESQCMYTNSQSRYGRYRCILQSTQRWSIYSDSQQKDIWCVPTVNRKLVVCSTVNRKWSVCSYIQSKNGGLFPQSTERWWVCFFNQQKGGRYVSTKNWWYVRQSTERRSVCFYNQQKDGRYVSSVNRKAVGMFPQSTERRSVCFFSQQKGGRYVSTKNWWYVRQSTERWSVCF